MNAVDWLLLALFAVSVVLGFWRGFVHSALSLAAWVLAYFVALYGAAWFALQLPMLESSPTLRETVAFVLLFVISLFAAGLVVALVRKLMHSAGLGGMDRMLGALFGVFRGIAILWAVALVVWVSPLHQMPAWQTSQLQTWVTGSLRSIAPFLPEAVSRSIPSDSKGPF